MKPQLLSVLAILVACAPLGADGPGDNVVAKVKPVPPPGIQVPADDQQKLTQGIEQLGKAIAERKEQGKDQAAQDLRPAGFFLTAFMGSASVGLAVPQRSGQTWPEASFRSSFLFGRSFPCAFSS